MNNADLEFDVQGPPSLTRFAAALGVPDMAKPAKPKVRQFLTIPNNPVGWVFLWYLRKRLNRGTYELRIYGRGQKWWVKLHNRIARKHNKPWRDRIKQIYDGPMPKGDAEYRERTAEVDKCWAHIWPTWGRSYFGSIKLRHAARFGVYFNEK